VKGGKVRKLRMAEFGKFFFLSSTSSKGKIDSLRDGFCIYRVERRIGSWTVFIL
jgi:hypothetical protein